MFFTSSMTSYSFTHHKCRTRTLPTRTMVSTVNGLDLASCRMMDQEIFFDLTGRW